MSASPDIVKGMNIIQGLTKDHPDIRLDEHDRSCYWCAAHEERCLRGQLLVLELLTQGIKECNR